MVSHGRYVTCQLAEVAVPRGLFREILRLINGLRSKSGFTRRRRAGIITNASQAIWEMSD